MKFTAITQLPETLTKVNSNKPLQPEPNTVCAPQEVKCRNHCYYFQTVNQQTFQSSHSPFQSHSLSSQQKQHNHRWWTRGVGAAAPCQPTKIEGVVPNIQLGQYVIFSKSELLGKQVAGHFDVQCRKPMNCCIFPLNQI